MYKDLCRPLGTYKRVLISDDLTTHFILLLAELTYYQFHCLLEILNLQTLRVYLVIFFCSLLDSFTVRSFTSSV